MDMKDYDRAQEHFKKAYLVEAEKDEISLVTLMEIHNTLVKIHVDDKKRTPQARIDQFKQYEPIVEKAYQNIKKNLPQDGNAAVYYKLAGELYCVSGNYPKALCQLNEAIELFLKEKSCDCSGLVKQCRGMLEYALSMLQKQKSSG